MLVSQMLKQRNTGVIEIEQGRPVRAAARLMAEHDIGAVLVRAGERMCGILSERDVARGVSRQGSRIADVAVESLMTPEVVTCRPSDDSDDLMRVMTEHGIRHLPVMAGGEIIGMVSIRNIVKARLTELETDQTALRNYIAGTT
jgi:CBS domain-containing protein